MSLTNRICIGLTGIAFGIVVLFAADMIFNGGRFVAHTVHAKHPDCSGTCHGSTDRQNAPRPAAILALPALQPIDQTQLKTDPGAIHCWECRWRLREATDGRR